MGALTINHNHLDQIDIRGSKKPKISSVIDSSSISRLNRYPEPTLKFTRAVHTPCRSSKFGVMGNALGFQRRIEILRSKFEQAKKKALNALSYVIPKLKKDDGVVGVEGLAVLLETEKLDGKVTENGGVVASLLERSERMLGSFYGEMPVYKRMLERVRRPNDKFWSLKFNVELEETRLQSIRKEKLVKSLEDSFHELFEPLSSEEEKEIHRAFSNSNRRKILVTHKNSNIEITGEILQCLRPGAWLNDEVINVYLELLKERERRDPQKFLHCHFFNTFFYKKLIGGRHGYDYKSVRRWTTHKRLGYGLAECDKIFVPIHKEVHWCLAVINKKDQKFQYLDSLGGQDSLCLNVLAKYYVDEVKDKSGQDIDVSSWELEFVDDLPAQQNRFDCGVFMIKYVDFYSRGMELHFSQEDMPYFRLRTAKEILSQIAE